MAGGAGSKYIAEYWNAPVSKRVSGWGWGWSKRVSGWEAGGGQRVRVGLAASTSLSIGMHGVQEGVGCRVRVGLVVGNGTMGCHGYHGLPINVDGTGCSGDVNPLHASCFAPAAEHRAADHGSQTSGGAAADVTLRSIEGDHIAGLVPLSSIDHATES